MRTNWGFSAGMVLVAVCALMALAGCGTGPIEQSYAIQSGAEPINAGIGDAKDVATEILVGQLECALPRSRRPAICRAALNGCGGW